MWILMVLSVLLAWVYPFQLLIRLQEHEVMLPSVIAVLVFWGAYACIDVCLYASNMLKELHGRLKQFWDRRAERSVSKNCLQLWQALMTNSNYWSSHELLALQLKNTEQVMALVSPLIMTQQSGYEEVVKKWLSEHFHSQSLQILALSYSRVQAHDLAFQSVQEIIFLGKMPFWMQAWTQDCRPSIEAMSQCPMPPVLPHKSWNPWLKRIVIAHISVANGIEGLTLCINALPSKWIKEKGIRWAVLDRLYVLGLGSEKMTCGFIRGRDEALVDLYEALYGAESMFLWEWKALILKFELCPEVLAPMEVSHPSMRDFLEMISGLEDGSHACMALARKSLTASVQRIATGRYVI